MGGLSSSDSFCGDWRYVEYTIVFTCTPGTYLFLEWWIRHGKPHPDVICFFTSYENYPNYEHGSLSWSVLSLLQVSIPMLVGGIGGTCSAVPSQGMGVGQITELERSSLAIGPMIPMSIHIICIYVHVHMCIYIVSICKYVCIYI